jgi:hypothetical protein
VNYAGIAHELHNPLHFSAFLQVITIWWQIWNANWRIVA